MHIRRTAFTLVELLVVIAIIGILVGLLLPAVQAAREAARRMQCQNNVKQLGLALHNYHSAYKTLPIGAYNINDRWGRLNAPNWRVELLPYIEQQNVYNQMSFDWQSNNIFSTAWVNVSEHLRNNEVLRDLLISTYRCPSSPVDPFLRDMGMGVDGSVMLANYVGCSGAAAPVTTSRPEIATWNHGFFGWTSENGTLMTNVTVKFGGITDGTSNTIAIAEQSGLVNRRQNLSSNRWGAWFGARNSRRPRDLGDFWACGVSAIAVPPNSNLLMNGTHHVAGHNTIYNSMHTGGINVALADGSIHFLSQNTDLRMLKRLCCRMDGEVALIEQ